MAEPAVGDPTPIICHTVRMEQRISLITLGVRDLAVARTFYEAIGWEGAQEPDSTVCFFQAGSMVFGLWTDLGGHGACSLRLASWPEHWRAPALQATTGRGRCNGIDPELATLTTGVDAGRRATRPVRSACGPPSPGAARWPLHR